jgi:hypothetical protein
MDPDRTITRSGPAGNGCGGLEVDLESFPVVLEDEAGMINYCPPA